MPRQLNRHAVARMIRVGLRLSFHMHVCVHTSTRVATSASPMPRLSASVCPGGCYTPGVAVRLVVRPSRTTPWGNRPVHVGFSRTPCELIHANLALMLACSCREVASSVVTLFRFLLTSCGGTHQGTKRHYALCAPLECLLWVVILLLLLPAV